MAADETGMGSEPVTRGSCHCGAVHWVFRGTIPDATICNCTVCRRYGVLWAYAYDGDGIEVEDKRGTLTRYICGSEQLSFNFCSRCGNLVSWRSLTSGPDGRTRIAVNLRLAEPDEVADVPLQRFDGFHSFEDLPLDGRTVKDVWF